jgi:tetratricopeptide (TPR) repeat protein
VKLALERLELAQKGTAGALEEINRKIAQSPNRQELYIMQGQVYAEKKEYAKAELSFRKALSLGSDKFTTYSLLGTLYADQNLYDKAIREFENALKINPKSAETWHSVGVFYQKQNNYPKAMLNYREALKINPQYAEAANNLAWLIGETGGNLDEALEFARMAKQKKPENLSILDTLGWTYYRRGAYRSAVDTLKECVAKKPDNPTYNFHLGMSYYKAGDKVSAKASLSKALNLDPKFKGAEEARAIIAKL